MPTARFSTTKRLPGRRCGAPWRNSPPFFAGAVCPVSRKNQALWELYELGKVTKDQLEIQRFLHFFDAAGMAGASPVEANEAYIGYLGQGAYLLPGALELIDTLRAKYSSIW